ncbi:MAG: TIGR03088 family PEP-CTERM/XrtA system glycosyltransferase [Proteobacteria bacterium]|nr:TIGR03088 family PEP-CTERM/XrtA system glycosyltransferase [Pseudomonadota bacterium]
MSKGRGARPLIAHVVFRFDIGGLENGVVNLVNRMPAERYRHAIIALTGITSFRERVTRGDVEFIALGKTPGHGIRLFPRLYRAFHRLRPAIVHTRNLAALEASIPAAMAGVPVRVHGEHGRDIGDLDGSNRTYRWVRRMHRPFVTHYVALSRDLERYLVDAVGVPAKRISRIVNGVDTERFAPAPVRAGIPGSPFNDPRLIVFGAVGRLQPVKNPALLARAFAKLVRESPDLRAKARLAIIGEGPERIAVERTLAEAGIAELAWLPGARDDVAAILRGFDVFVLPSIAEGISNTILEAMASGLPVIATAVGGNAELVDHAATGEIVPAQDVDALAAAMKRYAAEPERARAHGEAGRARALQRFSLDAMVGEYTALYDRLLARGVRVGRTAAPAHEGSR